MIKIETRNLIPKSWSPTPLYISFVFLSFSGALGSEVLAKQLGSNNQAPHLQGWVPHFGDWAPWYMGSKCGAWSPNSET